MNRNIQKIIRFIYSEFLNLSEKKEREGERERKREKKKKEMKLKIKAINKQSMDRLIWLNDIYTNQIQLI